MSMVWPGLTFPANAWVVGPFIESPLLNTTAYDGVHEQVPEFFNRQVLVKDSFGSRIVPSGMVTSVTKSPSSQSEVAVGSGALLVDEATANVTVGGAVVLVGTTGTVGGFCIAACVRFASTVWAAAVKTAPALLFSGSGVLPGRLHAFTTNARNKMMETSRNDVDIALVLLEEPFEPFRAGT